MEFAIFSGTFNPVHIGHLIMAESVKSELNLDKILFIPSFLPPHREDCFISPHDRLNMINLAIQNNRNFESSDIEIKRQEKSYSYLTVKKLMEQNNLSKINFIIGADAFSLIYSWYEVEKFAKLVRFIVIERPNNHKIKDIVNNINLKNIDFTAVKAPLIDISSSCIRERVKEGKSIKYLVPDLVDDYISQKKLYK